MHCDWTSSPGWAKSASAESRKQTNAGCTVHSRYDIGEVTSSELQQPHVVLSVCLCLNKTVHKSSDWRQISSLLSASYPRSEKKHSEGECSQSIFLNGAQSTRKQDSKQACYLIHREGWSNNTWKEIRTVGLPLAICAISFLLAFARLLLSAFCWCFFQLPTVCGNSPSPGGVHCHCCFRYESVHASTGAKEHNVNRYTNSWWLPEGKVPL